jgi:hypothetical protein
MSTTGAPTSIVTTTSTPATTVSPATTAATTTLVATTLVTTTTTAFPQVELPVGGPCAIDAVPQDGEITVVVGVRLYGLGEDNATPRCLVDGVTSRDIEWGPEGDRLRIGNTIITPSRTFSVDGALSLVWTTPTGKRIVDVAGDTVEKIDVDGSATDDITFLQQTTALAYHPAGTHVLAVGDDGAGQYGLWLANNEGEGPLLIASDAGAQVLDPAWTWLGEPVFVAAHSLGPWHIHRVDITEDGALEGPILVETTVPLDHLLPSPFDPVLIAYRDSASADVACTDGSHANVMGVDMPEPLASMTTSPVGWLSTERLLVLANPDGCGSPGQLWVFTAGFCPGSEYGVAPVIDEIDAAAARSIAPEPPQPPDFSGAADSAPA